MAPKLFSKISQLFNFLAPIMAPIMAPNALSELGFSVVQLVKIPFKKPVKQREWTDVFSQEELNEIERAFKQLGREWGAKWPNKIVM